MTPPKLIPIATSTPKPSQYCHTRDATKHIHSEPQKISAEPMQNVLRTPRRTMAAPIRIDGTPTKKLRMVEPQP